MTRLGHLVKGLGALVLLAALVVAIPWALWHFVGWPLPHHVPSASQVGRALNHQGIPDQTLVDALAVVVWLTWAVLVASIAVEIPAALSGRHAPRLPLAGIFQPITGRLVVAVIVACLTLAPRPGHLATPGSSGGDLSTATVRRPVAALVLKDTTVRETVLTDASRPLTTTGPPTPATAVAASPPAATTPAAPSPAASTTYVVQRGDTLWGIAQRQLGDPLRWSEIYQLNVGRPQPDGATLTDPHWIDPGWTLVLPSRPAPSIAPTAPTAPSTATPSPSPAPVAPPAPAPTTEPTTPVPAPASPPVRAQHETPQTSGIAPRQAAHTADPVRLPSGSVVAGSFAAGVLSAVALGRLRRRHAYRYRPPEPGRDLTPVPIRLTLRHLAQSVRADDEADATAAHDAVPVFPVADDERRLDPGRLEVGTRAGATVTVEVTDLSGVAITGAVVDDVARALVAGLLVRAVPGATEVLLTEPLADRLLPGVLDDRSLRRCDSTDDMARTVEAERVARARRLDSVDAADATSFRHDNPENPLPLLVVLLDSVPAESHGRWSALLADAPGLGIAIIFLDDSPLATTRIELDANGTVTSHTATRTIGGAALYRLRPDEAAELLGAVNDANREPDEDDPDWAEPHGSITPLHNNGNDLQTAHGPDSAGWPEPPDFADSEDRPIVVEVLGPFHITIHGQAITSGLRGRARALFAWYLLRPEGATIDEAVDALWPSTDPEQVRRQFWRPFGDLRTRLRSTGDDSLEVLEKIGEHYRPHPGEITCDLWSFQAALGDAAGADDGEAARVALRRALDAYRGDLLSGVGYSWVEPVRQDLHRRALDAQLRLAELDDRAGHPELAVAVLEQAIDLDRYAEEPYRRLMALHAAHGRPDAVTATWQLLRSRLADLDVDMDETTARLYRTLTTTDSPAPRPVRLSS
ncbi:MAG TPA: BTAD domain-containing putative transcriptional regulator [Acidimicrobiales bacterium]|jgi:DNA-binding SARP family transcriptional activator|nr:BTAD domain-containing putative transcriptional regulator [Acidimicrobiales bacterium]